MLNEFSDTLSERDAAALFPSRSGKEDSLQSVQHVKVKHRRLPPLFFLHICSQSLIIKQFHRTDFSTEMPSCHAWMSAGLLRCSRWSSRHCPPRTLTAVTRWKLRFRCVRSASWNGCRKHLLQVSVNATCNCLSSWWRAVFVNAVVWLTKTATT